MNSKPASGTGSASEIRVDDLGITPSFWDPLKSEGASESSLIDIRVSSSSPDEPSADVKSRILTRRHACLSQMHGFIPPLIISLVLNASVPPPTERFMLPILFPFLRRGMFLEHSLSLTQ